MTFLLDDESKITFSATIESDVSDENTEPPANQATKVIIIITCVVTFLLAAIIVAGFVGCARRRPKARHLLRLS